MWKTTSRTAENPVGIGRCRHGVGGKPETSVERGIRAGAPRTADDLHLLSAMPRDLGLSEARDAELRAAHGADEVDVQLIDVLDLLALGSSLSSGGRAEQEDPDPQDQESDRHCDDDVEDHGAGGSGGGGE